VGHKRAAPQPSPPRWSNWASLGLIVTVGLGIALFTLTQTGPPAIRAATALSLNGSGTNSSPGAETTYRLELLNHTDQIVFDGILTATLPAGFSYVSGSTVVMGEGWPMPNREPAISGQTLTWGPYNLPAAGIQVHNPFGIHTMLDSCNGIPALHLEGAKTLVGNGGYITQLFYPVDTQTSGPSQCAINFVQEAYARNLIPILRLQGHRVNGIWQAPTPGPNGNYAEIARAYANYVAGLPRRDTNPLYIAVWNEPDLWIEWSNRPNATEYARFFVAVSNAIRQLGDARIRVVNGALTPGNSTFLDKMLRVPGFRDAFDLWASHCYPYNHPASYNIHSGTARYGTYAIDCYLQETALINRYGRSGFKVILTETGYALGNNTFGFEGYPTINESNRATYITSAFRDYWQKWPEIVAVTPFELTDPAGFWTVFDWLYPTWPYPPHPQYSSVAALPKPAGQLQPYGYQVIFKASVAPQVVTGTYSLHLWGSERNGTVVSATHAASVTISAAAPPQASVYLPLILKSPGNQGPWYGALPPAPATTDGAIVPTHILTGPAPLLKMATATTPQFEIDLAGPPLGLALDEAAAVGLVLLANGQLHIVDLPTGQANRSLFVGSSPQRVITGPPGRAYVSLADGLALVDTVAGRLVSSQLGVGLLRGMAFDSATGRLFVTDAEQNQLRIFKADLSQQLAPYPLPHQPNQLLLDGQTRQLYLAFPAVAQVMALHADHLTATGPRQLAGGPIVDMALDSAQNRLYILNALTPNHHALSVWQTPQLKQVALLAGAGQLSFPAATAVSLTPDGHPLVAAGSGLWQISADSFTITRQYRPVSPSSGGPVQVDQGNGAIYALTPTGQKLAIFPR